MVFRPWKLPYLTGREDRADAGFIPRVNTCFPQTEGPQTWGLVIDRSYPRSVRTRMRSAPTDRNTTCLLCGANKITGFQNIVPGGGSR